MKKRRSPRHRGYQKNIVTCGTIIGSIIGLIIMSVIMFGTMRAINVAYDRLVGNEHDLVLVEETETER